jgi:hypothetical protein
MRVLRGIKSNFACFQLKRLPLIRFEKQRSLEHVNSLISGMIVVGRNPARRNVGEKYDDFFALQTGHGLPQDLCSRYLWSTLRADVGSSNGAYRNA